MTKAVVYTAIADNYDFLRPVPKNLRGRLEFVCFSNQRYRGGRRKGWEIRDLISLASDPIRACRFVKVSPHEFFPEYEISLWLDGNISFNEGLLSCLKNFHEGKEKIVGVKHPTRNCIYAEARECVRLKKDIEEVIEEQVLLIDKHGFPEGFGLTETNILFRKHLDSSVTAMMNEWWHWIEGMSKRDQLSFDFVRWKHQVGMGYLEQDAHGENEAFRRGLHRSESIIRNAFSLIEAYQMVVPGATGVVNHSYGLSKVINRLSRGAGRRLRGVI